MATITFYGGVGEIGGNAILVEDGETRVFLDFGVSFGKKELFYEEFLQPRTNAVVGDLLRLGVLPKVNGIYRQDLLQPDGLEDALAELNIPSRSLWKREVESYDAYLAQNGHAYLSGVILSHAHLDHCEHISFLSEEVPVYCSPTTRRVLEAVQQVGRTDVNRQLLRVQRRYIDRLKGGYFPGTPTVRTTDADRTFVDLSAAAETIIGELAIRPFTVDHSIPGAYAFILRTSEGKTIIYTGDLRFHGYRGDDTKVFVESLRDSNPDVLICEGTRIANAEPDSEEKVLAECVEAVSAARGLAMVDFAWRDVARYRTMREVARQTGRTLVISAELAFLLKKMSGLAEEVGVDDGLGNDVKVYVKRRGAMLYSPGDYVNAKHEAGLSARWEQKDESTVATEHLDHGVRAYDIRGNPSAFLLHLDFFELSELIDLEPPAGSVYIRARSEPFNEEMELDENRLCNWLRQFGINAPTYEPIYIHASGHAGRPDLERLAQAIKPKVLYPIHTEHPEAFEDLLPSGTQLVKPEVGLRYLV